MGQSVRGRALRLAVARAGAGLSRLEGISARRRNSSRAADGSTTRHRIASFSYDKSGFETSAYTLASDQFGTQLDPPAHWHQCFPAIDELPPTVALRKLAVISIVDKVRSDVNYHLSVDDIRAWEKRNGAIPAGSVSMVRSDW